MTTRRSPLQAVVHAHRPPTAWHFGGGAPPLGPRHHEQSRSPTLGEDATMEVEGPHCLTAVHPDALTGGGRPWAPGNREEHVDIERAATDPDDRVWCMSEVDIFCDLDEREMDAMAAAAPMKTY